VQAALDLAEAGAKAIMVENTPAIGGKMAALDKNFPTLDCSICIEGPKLSEVDSHPNIELLSNAEVINVEGEPGNFDVTIRQKPRFVDSECTRCSDCVDPCPVILPNTFDSDMAARKAIYTPFSQAVPGEFVIDIEHCLNEPPIYLPCSRCMDACKPEVISFDDYLPKDITKNVTSIILSTGFDLVDPHCLPEYSYGKHPDILTAMEFERILTSAGPSGGEIVKPSDGTHPESITFVLCAGSRDVRHQPYCSGFCCMYTIKEAYQALDHGIPEIKVLYMDVRAYGKGFDGFRQRAMDEGLQFIRGKPAKITTDDDTGEITIHCENTKTGKIEHFNTDMVILATGVLPSRSLKDLSSILDIELDTDGFVKSLEEKDGMLSTTREGIFSAGGPSGPKDIPDSVAQATGAAAVTLQYLTERDWPEEDNPPEMDVANQTPKIGVFLCDCGSNIAGVIDVPKNVEYAKTLPYVEHSEELMFACAANSVDHIAEVVAEKKLNRVVLSACSPKTHEGIFKKSLKKGGLNPFLLEMANVRNMDSWVHKKNPGEATAKAEDMISMAVSKAITLTPLYMSKEPVIQKVLVVGGGVSGIVAATALAKQKIETYLVEEKSVLGGLLNDLHELGPGGVEVKTYLKNKIKELKSTKTKIFTETKIEMVGGAVGNFFVRMQSSNGSPDKLTELQVGAIILATGATPYQPEEFQYGSDERVITNYDLEKHIDNSLPDDNYTFIGCVGSRNEKMGCSRYCCESMIQQAISLRKKKKNVRIVAKDIRTFSRHAEEQYFEALKSGVRFFRYDTEKPPQDVIKYSNGMVEFHDEMLNTQIKMQTDKLVLVAGLVPPEGDIYQQLRVSKSEDSFLLEKHPKLGPCEVASPGIYLAGTAQSPKNVRDSVAQSLGAVAKASALVAKPFIEKEPLTAKIDPEKCNGCGLCEKVCPYNAITMLEPEEGEKRGNALVNTSSCTGCGTCSAECNKFAISTPFFEDEQIYAQIDAALQNKPEEKCIVFACNWCSYAGADQAGIEKLQYPPVARIIRTMCSGRIRREFIERSFEKGAGSVLVTGCHIHDCHYLTANHHTLKRFERWKKKAIRQGIDADRIQLQWISAAEGKEFAAKINEMETVTQNFCKNPQNGNGKIEKKAEAV
jgi:heterodisulfide reductase subunit A